MPARRNTPPAVTGTTPMVRDPMTALEWLDGLIQKPHGPLAMSARQLYVAGTDPAGRKANAWRKAGPDGAIVLNDAMFATGHIVELDIVAMNVDATLDGRPVGEVLVTVRFQKDEVPAITIQSKPADTAAIAKAIGLDISEEEETT